MAGKDRNWVHGADVNVEWPNRLANTAAGDHEPLRQGFGSTVRQNGSHNWFHFAVPTPQSELEDAMLWAEVNPEATVDKVHIRVGTELHEEITGSDDGFPFENENIDRKWNIRDKNIEGPVCLCVHANFKQGGQIRFVGGGAQFDR